MGKGARNRAIRKRALILSNKNRSVKTVARRLRKVARSCRQS